MVAVNDGSMTIEEKELRRQMRLKVSGFSTNTPLGAYAYHSTRCGIATGHVIAIRLLRMAGKQWPGCGVATVPYRRAAVLDTDAELARIWELGITEP
jgi:hypothetical protein